MCLLRFTVQRHFRLLYAQPNQPAEGGPLHEQRGAQFLELALPRAVVPLRLFVYESRGAGALLRVRGRGASWKPWRTLWERPEGAAAPPADARVLEAAPLVWQGGEGVLEVRLELDTSEVAGYSQVDAIEVHGYEADDTQPNYGERAGEEERVGDHDGEPLVRDGGRRGVRYGRNLEHRRVKIRRAQREEALEPRKERRVVERPLVL